MIFHCFNLFAQQFPQELVLFLPQKDLKDQNKHDVQLLLVPLRLNPRKIDDVLTQPHHVLWGL